MTSPREATAIFDALDAQHPGAMQHGQDFGHMGTAGLFALGHHLVNDGQLGAQFPVLPILLVPLPGDGNVQRDHVGKCRAALTEHQLNADVGLLPGLCHFGFGACDRFPLLHQRDQRVVFQLGF